MHSEPLPDLASATRATMNRVLARLVVARLFLAPVLVAVVVTFTALAPSAWRVGLGTTVVCAIVGLFTGEYVRWRRGWSGPRALPANVVGMLWIQALVVGVSGGLYSPLLPILPPMTLQVALVFGRSPALAWVLAGQLAALWAYAGLELGGWSLRIPALGASPHGDRWAVITAVFLTGFLAVAAAAGSKARVVVADLVSNTIAAHDRERVLHAEQARELVTLSGEIAHELKNPLASIKGLSALLARDLTGKDAERLAVLRAEVDRMHETLDEFLDFSRPVVPLVTGSVDLAALASEVVAVCEGVAASGEVKLVTRGAGEAVADRRKLRQVLVNLLQNAIEAAPPRSEVEVVVAPSQVDVLDRGAGVADDVRDAVFEPGVTTRSRGSGLGLTIARALVQQHGGQLALEPRAGGGTRARVTLGAT